MAKIKYEYNPESVSYHKIEESLKTRLVGVLKHILSSSVLAIVIVFILFHFFGSPKERSLQRDNQALTNQISLMNTELNQIQEVLNDLQQRDDNIYRVIFEAEPIHTNIRKSGFGGVNRYAHLENLPSSDIVISTKKRLDKLSKSIYVQSKSYDEVENKVKRKFEMLSAIPAILPIAIKDFGRISAGYGYRIHPIYKTKKMHHGMDFTGNLGTPVYATGDGVIESAKKHNGYGKTIVVNHGYNYKTYYAHLNGYNVKKGQKVKRGEVIGYLGNSGVSTGPHLHYEVRLNNRPQNPVQYYFNDLTADEYDQMVSYAMNTGQSMD
ncbi:MAG: M23 family metallopeptidase [Marinifilaceae bacterium]|jgi:murein DD-endopeptidase MepM/ murein hydrolase activator NlpD|nr:M23 family metallopeptidase [Marinifilaceae bacterium]